MSRHSLEKLGAARLGLPADPETGGISNDEWGINGTRITNLIEEERDWQELRLTWRVSKSTRDNVLAGLEENAGDYDVLSASDGTFTTIDRASGGNTYKLEPPMGRKELRYYRDYLVKDYSEELIDQSGGQYEVTIQFVAAGNKEKRSDFPTSVPKGADEWKFEFSESEIVTTRINQKLVREGKDGVEWGKLKMGLERDEARIMEESVRALGASTVREIPDGDNVPKDYSRGDLNTVKVHPPANTDAFPGGEYIVDGWKTRWTNNDYFEVGLDLMRKV